MSSHGKVVLFHVTCKWFLRIRVSVRCDFNRIVWVLMVKSWLHTNQTVWVLMVKSWLHTNQKPSWPWSYGIKLVSDLRQSRWFSPDTLVSSTNKPDHHDMTEILLKVVLNTITLTPITHKSHKQLSRENKSVNYFLIGNLHIKMPLKM
jgi:hypothetical protein